MRRLIIEVIRFLGYDLVKYQKPDLSFQFGQDYEEYAKTLSVPGFFTFNAFKLFKSLGETILDDTKRKPLNILEIGIYCGQSLLGLGLIFKKQRIVGVDPFYESFLDSPALVPEAKYLANHSSNTSGKFRFNALKAEIGRLGLSENITVSRVTQEKFLKTRINNKFQFAYIDGEHSFPSIAAYINNVSKIMDLNSVLVIDDFLSAGYPGISEAMHTHRVYKTDIRPICYGFNKGVFGYKMNPREIKKLISAVRDFAITNQFDFHEHENDGALVIRE